ncbi:MAG: hypothetical protein ACK4Z9_06865 [Thermodesulfovibrionales bacterium]
MKEIVLPSGKRATIKDGKGRDLLNAQRKVKSPEEILYALLAELTEIDGQRLVYEDILEMDLQDVLALQMEIAGNFQFPPPNTLSTLQKQQDGALGRSKK